MSALEGQSIVQVCSALQEAVTMPALFEPVLFKKPSLPSRAAGIGLVLAVLAVAGCRQGYPPELSLEVPPPPETRVEAVTDVLHGLELNDPYRWLEDQDSADTRAWIERQNAYTDQVLGDLPQRQPAAERLAELFETDVTSAPLVRGERYFFSRRLADQDLLVIYLREGSGGADQVLLDPHDASEDHSISYQIRDASADGGVLAYAVRSGGQDETEIRFLDVVSGQDLPEVLKQARYSTVALTPDASAVYYSRLEADGPRLFHHPMGTDPAEDRQVFGEELTRDKLLYANLSEDGEFLTVNVLHGSSNDHSEVYLMATADQTWTTVVADIPARFLGSVIDGQMVMSTNWMAPKGRVLAVDAENPHRDDWREVVAERDDAAIQSISAGGGRLFVSYLVNVASQVEMFDLEGQSLGGIELGTLGSVLGLGGSWTSKEVFFNLTSFALPATVYRYDVDSGERSVWASSEMPINSDSFAVEQLWFESADGTRVPMFVVHQRDLELDGSHPLVLTGYGGFNVSNTPRFSASAAVWVEQGGVFAIANLRGGGEFGGDWHAAGSGAVKQNTFDDFIAAAEHLIASGYTKPERLAIRGGSNGGLLVGAVSNQRPDLFAAAVCSYPLLDMVRYHQFMMGPYWIGEYGSADDAEMFAVLRAYSPYHNVEQEAHYPATLYVTGDGDTRVAPLHARKMAALMQATHGNDTPILLRYHLKAGHAGPPPVSEQVANQSETLAFLLWQLGVS
nr:prolyl endopeptidase-like [Nerophis lumbriciformis]